MSDEDVEAARRSFLAAPGPETWSALESELTRLHGSVPWEETLRAMAERAARGEKAAIPVTECECGWQGVPHMTWRVLRHARKRYKIRGTEFDATGCAVIGACPIGELTGRVSKQTGERVMCCGRNELVVVEHENPVWAPVIPRAPTPSEIAATRKRDVWWFKVEDPEASLRAREVEIACLSGWRRQRVINKLASEPPRHRKPLVLGNGFGLPPHPLDNDPQSMKAKQKIREASKTWTRLGGAMMTGVSLDDVRVYSLLMFQATKAGPTVWGPWIGSICPWLVSLGTIQNLVRLDAAVRTLVAARGPQKPEEVARSP